MPERRTPDEEDALQRQREEYARAWHAARERTFERWLEAHHDRITKLPGFRRLTWPSATAGAAIRMETERACQEVRVLLAAAGLTEFDDEPTVDVDVA